MRLTLRTMLAYRDRVLRPADAEDLHRRIQSSEDAGNLLRRIDSLAKHHFAPSPTIVGKGLSGDPNSYAEYLDDVLVSEKVPEFEKSCLESDVHLNELAECHSLLSSAIHTRVRVPDNLHSLAMEIGNPEQRQIIKEKLKDKRRTQGNGQIVRADLAHPVPTPQGESGKGKGLNEEQIVCVQAPMVASGGTSIREQGLNLENSKLAHEVPEYLVGKNRGSWRIPVAIGVLLAALGLLVWQALGPWDKIQSLFAGDSQLESPNENKVSAVEGENESAAVGKSQALRETDDSLPASDSEGDASSSIDSNAATPGREENISPATEENGSVKPPVNGTGTEGSDPETATSDVPTSEPPPAPPANAAWLPNDQLEKQAVVLSRSANGISRLLPGAELQPGVELAIPPFFNTTIDLPGGTLWETSGPSVLTIGSEASVNLESSLCRAMVRAGPRGNKLSFKSPVGESKITLGRGGSVAAIEVAYRMRKHGPVTDRACTVPVLIIVCGDGLVNCEFASKNYSLQTGTGLAVIDGENPREFNLRNIPAWFRKSNIRPIDKLAREDLDVKLQNAKGDLSQSLVDLAKSRQPYLASLASQTCMLLENWTPFIEHTLDDARQSSYWHQSIQLARQLIASAPSRAQALEQAIQQKTPGSPSFELLVGLPADSYADTSGLEPLVNSLDSERLGERVLAINHLQRATEVRMNFLPHQPSRTSLQKWRLELSKDRLKVQSPPDLIWEQLAP